MMLTHAHTPCMCVHTASGLSQAVLFRIQGLQHQDQLSSRHHHTGVQVQTWSDRSSGLQSYGWVMDRCDSSYCT